MLIVIFQRRGDILENVGIETKAEQVADGKTIRVLSRKASFRMRHYVRPSLFIFVLRTRSYLYILLLTY